MKGGAASFGGKRLCFNVPGHHHRQIPHSCCIPNRRPYSSTCIPFNYRHDGANFSTHRSNSRVSRYDSLGSRAFVDCELFALVDLFDKFALPLDTVVSNTTKFINHDGLKRLMNAVGESPTEEMIQKLFEEADADDNGVIDLDVRSIE
jgi:hypothetical protein